MPASPRGGKSTSPAEAAARPRLRRPWLGRCPSTRPQRPSPSRGRPRRRSGPHRSGPHRARRHRRRRRRCTRRGERARSPPGPSRCRGCTRHRRRRRSADRVVLPRRHPRRARLRAGRAAVRDVPRADLPPARACSRLTVERVVDAVAPCRHGVAPGGRGGVPTAPTTISLANRREGHVGGREPVRSDPEGRPGLADPRSTRRCAGVHHRGGSGEGGIW